MHLCQQKTMECHLDERGIPCEVCNNLANYLPTRKVNIFQQSYCHHFEFGKQGKKDQLMFHYVDTNVNKIDVVDSTPKANCSRVGNT
jgi:hypothetical protein